MTEDSCYILDMSSTADVPLAKDKLVELCAHNITRFLTHHMLFRWISMHGKTTQNREADVTVDVLGHLFSPRKR